MNTTLAWDALASWLGDRGFTVSSTPDHEIGSLMGEYVVPLRLVWVRSILPEKLRLTVLIHETIHALCCEHAIEHGLHALPDPDVNELAARRGTYIMASELGLMADDNVRCAVNSALDHAHEWLVHPSKWDEAERIVDDIYPLLCEALGDATAREHIA